LIILLAMALIPSGCAGPWETDKNPEHAYVEGMADLLLDLDTRTTQGGVAKRLGDFRGPEAQILRLLLWAKETRPKFRKELMTQWLCDLEELPYTEALLSALRRLCQCYTQVEISARLTEAEQILGALEPERSKKKRRIVGSGSGNAMVKLVPDATLLGTKVFDASAKMRKEAYLEWSKPFVTFAEPGACGPACETGDYDLEVDERGGRIYVLMWIVEPEKDLRREILVPRIEKTHLEEKAPDDYWFKKLEPNLACMTEQQKESRRKTIRSMKLPVWTKEDGMEGLAEGFRLMEAEIEQLRAQATSRARTSNNQGAYTNPPLTKKEGNPGADWKTDTE